MQGLILFAMLGGELLVQYKVTVTRRGPLAGREAETAG
jgi:hypothetical protein